MTDLRKMLKVPEPVGYKTKDELLLENQQGLIQHKQATAIHSQVAPTVLENY